MGWRIVGVVTEGGDINVKGLNPWNFEWRALETAPLDLPHPSCLSQQHKMKVYEIEATGMKVTFAAGELSANVWGFYVPS